MISPKIKTTIVKTPVAIPIATDPQSLIASVVAKEDAEILTILFPISK